MQHLLPRLLRLDHRRRHRHGSRPLASGIRYSTDRSRPCRKVSGLYLASTAA
jgi:hypothetical protein